MNVVKYILTKSKNMHTLLHAVYECLCGKKHKNVHRNGKHQIKDSSSLWG